jgi:hypothetical protein
MEAGILTSSLFRCPSARTAFVGRFGFGAVRTGSPGSLPCRSRRQGNKTHEAKSVPDYGMNLENLTSEQPLSAAQGSRSSGTVVKQGSQMVRDLGHACEAPQPELAGQGSATRAGGTQVVWPPCCSVGRLHYGFLLIVDCERRTRSPAMMPTDSGSKLVRRL